MVLFASVRDLSGIFSTQVGDPLAHRQEGRAHAASFDGLSTTAGSAVSETKHEEVAELAWLHGPPLAAGMGGS